MSDQFIPGNHPNAYTESGDFLGNVPEDDDPTQEVSGLDLGASTPPPAQVTSPAGETDGYKAPGGSLRLSIRDRIAAVAPYSSKLVPVEEWGIEAEIRSLSLGERNEMLNKAAGDDGDADIRSIYPEMVVRCTFDPETGERVFGDDDIAFINSRPANLVDKLAVPAMELSGMADDAVEDEAKKSSKTEPSG